MGVISVTYFILPVFFLSITNYNQFISYLVQRLGLFYVLDILLCDCQSFI